MNDKKFTGLIMVDLKKAFDTVSHKILLRKLQNYGIRGVVGKLITNYLSDRKQYVTRLLMATSRIFAYLK